MGQWVTEVGGQRIGGAEVVLAGADLNGAVTACGVHELPYAPACLAFDPVTDGQRYEHDVEVSPSMDWRLWW